MLRYKLLILRALDPDAPHPLKLRELARTLDIPVPSLHNYVNFDTLPRTENIEKIAHHFGESLSSLFSEDDDDTAKLIAVIRRLTPERKQQLLREL